MKTMSFKSVVILSVLFSVMMVAGLTSLSGAQQTGPSVLLDSAGWRTGGFGDVPSAAERRIILKNLITNQNHITVPGVYDAISARVAEKAGFPVIYCGSYSTAASQFGLPDVYMVNWTEMADKVRTIVNATNIPVIADAENGFGPATNMWRVVQALEQAGASAIHIEDGEFGKHTDLPPTYASMGLTVGKIRAAVDARQDPNFLIIARVDVPNVDEAVTRGNAYLDAGADVVFPTGCWTGKTLNEMKAVRNRFKGKVLTVGMGLSSAQEEFVGINIVLHYDLAIAAAYPAVKVAMERLKKTEDINALSDILSRVGFSDFLGIPFFVQKYNEYMKPYMP